MRYVSDKTKKTYDSVEELEKAEAEFDKAEEEKKAKALARKNEASKVEEAFKALNAGRKIYNEKVSAAKKIYLEEVAKSNEKLNEVIKSESTTLETLEDVYHNELAEFNKAHPEGYHITLKDGDTVKTISRIGDFDFFNDFFDSFTSSFFKRF